MKHCTRIVALFLIVAAAAPARAQISTAADTLVSTPSNASIALPLVAAEPSFHAIAKSSNGANSALQSEFSTVGAPLVGLRAGVHARETARPLQPTAAPAHANLGQSRAMMIVGAAGLIAGAIIGGTPGTVVMVGGAVVGLFGLYDYLQ